MQTGLHHRPVARDLFVALAALALAFKLVVPPGFMPGTSLSLPIVMCTGQGPMPAMAMADMPGHAHGSDKAPHAGDHDCPFAGVSLTPLTPEGNTIGPSPAVATAEPLPSRPQAASPGRGLAAPPPPSHAPPVAAA